MVKGRAIRPRGSLEALLSWGDGCVRCPFRCERNESAFGLWGSEASRSRGGGRVPVVCFWRMLRCDA